MRDYESGINETGKNVLKIFLYSKQSLRPSVSTEGLFFNPETKMFLG